MFASLAGEEGVVHRNRMPRVFTHDAGRHLICVTVSGYDVTDRYFCGAARGRDPRRIVADLISDLREVLDVLRVVEIGILDESAVLSEATHDVGERLRRNLLLHRISRSVKTTFCGRGSGLRPVKNVHDSHSIACVTARSSDRLPLVIAEDLESASKSYPIATPLYSLAYSGIPRF